VAEHGAYAATVTTIAANRTERQLKVISLILVDEKQAYSTAGKVRKTVRSGKSDKGKSSM
jgi:hypothetical protein